LSPKQAQINECGVLTGCAQARGDGSWIAAPGSEMSSLAHSSTPPSSLEGSLIGGKFRLERVLGEGGMGVVYAAVHLDLRKHVAIKLIRDELATHPEVVERMLNEARIAASLRSEHVARVLDVGTLDTGAPFIVMEYLDGADLATMLEEQGPLSPTTAIDYVIQACEAVAEAHAAGIVHRDIKPDNIFISNGADGEPMAKVLDFGVSKVLVGDRAGGVVTNPSSLIGSPSYMAPEAMQDSEQAGAPADVWSLGAVLYELVSGQRPFGGKNLPEVCAKVLSVDPPLLQTVAPGVPAALEEIVLRCLERDPTKRITVLELAAALAPLGSAESSAVVKRIERVASGIRLKPRSLAPSAKSSGVLSPLSISMPPAHRIAGAVALPMTSTLPPHRPWLKVAVGVGAIVSVAMLAAAFTVARGGRAGEVETARTAIAARSEILVAAVAAPARAGSIEAASRSTSPTAAAPKAAVAKKEPATGAKHAIVRPGSRVARAAPDGAGDDAVYPSQDAAPTAAADQGAPKAPPSDDAADAASEYKAAVEPTPPSDIAGAEVKTPADPQPATDVVAPSPHSGAAPAEPTEPTEPTEP